MCVHASTCDIIGSRRTAAVPALPERALRATTSEGIQRIEELALAAGVVEGT
jgi:hypothetical protein